MPKGEQQQLPEIEVISILAKFTDGKCRQIAIEKSTEEMVLRLIATVEGSVKVIEEPIETIDIVKASKK